MASLRQTPNGTFIVCFRFRGDQYQRSLKTKQKRDANAMRSKVELTLFRLSNGEIAIPDNVSPPDYIVTGKTKPDLRPTPQSLSFAELIEPYFEEHRYLKATSTLETERTHLNNLRRSLEAKAHKPLKGIEKRDLNAALKTRIREVGGTTVMKERQTLVSFFAWACEQFHVISSPAVGLETFEKSGNQDRFRTLDEIDESLGRGGLSSKELTNLWKCLYLDERRIAELLALMEVRARHDFVFPLVALAAFTGMRRGEILRLRWCDVDFQNDILTARSRKQSRQQRETSRHIQLHPDLKTILLTYKENRPRGQYVACRTDESARLTNNMAHHHLHATLRGTRWERDLSAEHDQTHKKVVIGFHTFRHSFASNLASKGVDQRVIDAMMGHQTEEMRKRYRHLFPKDRRAAIECLNFRDDRGN